MCKYCEFDELENCNKVASDVIEVTIGSRKLEDHILNVFMIKNGDGRIDLYSGYSIDGDNDVAKVRVPIMFCPFCGRTLEH